MRLLFFTDTHLDDRPPGSRTEQYADQIMAKMEEVRELAETCDVTVDGGDDFHRRQLSFRLLRRYSALLRGWPHNVIGIAGNHTLPPELMAGLDRVPLGMLEEAQTGGRYRFAREDVVVGTGPTVQIHPVHWFPHEALLRDGREEEALRLVNEAFRVERQPGVDFVVAVAHLMIMPGGGGWPFPAIAADQIDLGGIDVLLLAHLHFQTGMYWAGGTLVVGPGSIARTQMTQSEMARTPQVAVLEFADREVTAKFVPLRSARPGAEVFVEASRPAAGHDLFAGYVAALEADGSVEGLSVEEAVESLQGRARPEVLERAREFWERAGAG